MTGGGHIVPLDVVAALAVHAGIKPWEVELLTLGEINAVVDYLNG